MATYLEIAARNPLSENLVAHWKLDEASGTRFDETSNDHDLTDNSSVGQSTGKLTNAADFSGSNYLSRANASLGSLNPGGTFSVVCWAKLDVLSSQRAFVSLWSGSNNAYLLSAAVVSTNLRLQGQVASTMGSATATNSTNLSTGTWYFCSLVFNGSNGNVSLRLNNGSETTASLSGTLRQPASEPFLLGASLGGTQMRLDGQMDGVAFWSRTLTTSDLDLLWNNGNGTDDLTSSRASVAGGSSTPQATYSPFVSGGATCGGTAAERVQIHSTTASGGVVSSGMSPNNQTLTNGGGVVIAGSTPSNAVYGPTASGTALLGGAASWQSGIGTSGGATCGGSATPTLTMRPSTSGGALCNATAAYFGSQSYIPSGGVVCGSPSYANSFKRRMMIRVPAGAVNAAIEKFYLRVSVDLPSGIANEFRFEDVSGSWLPHETRSFSANRLTAYVKTTLTSSENNLFLYFDR